MKQVEKTREYSHLLNIYYKPYSVFSFTYILTFNCISVLWDKSIFAYLRKLKLREFV